MASLPERADRRAVPPTACVTSTGSITMQNALVGKRVLITRSAEFMGPVLCEVFAEQSAIVLASPEALTVLTPGSFAPPTAPTRALGASVPARVVHRSAQAAAADRP